MFKIHSFEKEPVDLFEIVKEKKVHYEWVEPPPFLRTFFVNVGVFVTPFLCEIYKLTRVCSAIINL